MKIAIYGSSLLSAYWNGAATYYRGILRALAPLGHDITFFEPDAFDRQSHRDIDPPPWCRVVVYPATETGVRDVLAQAARADVVIKASGVGVFDDVLLNGILACAAPGALRLFWDVDAPATLAEIAGRPDHTLRLALPELDLVLTYGGGDPVVSAYRGFGALDCVPIYNALDPSTHHPVPPEDRFAADLTFLGNRLPDREQRVEAFILGAAARRPIESVSAWRLRMGGQTLPCQRRQAWPRADVRAQRPERQRPSGAEHQSRQYGIGWLLPCDSRVRSGRSRRLPADGCLGGDRAVPDAGQGGAGGS